MNSYKNQWILIKQCLKILFGLLRVHSHQNFWFLWLWIVYYVYILLLVTVKQLSCAPDELRSKVRLYTDLTFVIYYIQSFSAMYGEVSSLLVRSAHCHQRWCTKVFSFHSVRRLRSLQTTSRVRANLMTFHRHQIQFIGFAQLMRPNEVETAVLRS